MGTGEQSLRRTVIRLVTRLTDAARMIFGKPTEARRDSLLLDAAVALPSDGRILH